LPQPRQRACALVSADVEVAQWWMALPFAAICAGRRFLVSHGLVVSSGVSADHVAHFFHSVQTGGAPPFFFGIGFFVFSRGPPRVVYSCRHPVSIRPPSREAGPARALPMRRMDVEALSPLKPATPSRFYPFASSLDLCSRCYNSALHLDHLAHGPTATAHSPNCLKQEWTVRLRHTDPRRLAESSRDGVFGRA